MWAETLEAGLITQEADLTILLPAYNEEVAIGQVLDDIEALPINCRVIVADSASTDRTPNIVRDRGITLLNGKRGKGNAIREALEHIKTPYVAMLDADGTYPVESLTVIPEMLSNYDVVKGHRKWHADGAMSRTHKFGNRVLSLLASVLYRHWVRDVCSGFWGFRQGCLDKFRLTSSGFTLEADLFVNTVKNGYTLLEFPIVYKSRAEGDKPKLKIMNGLGIGWFLLKRRWSYGKEV